MDYYPDSRHAPAPKPLRILKGHRARNTSSHSFNDNIQIPISIPIPRRRSSHAIRGPHFTDIPPLPEFDKTTHNLRQPQKHWLSLSTTPPASSNYPAMGKLFESKEPTRALLEERKQQTVPAPKNGLFSRVTQAFDFKSRQTSHSTVKVNNTAKMNASARNDSSKQPKKIGFALKSNRSPGGEKVSRNGVQRAATPPLHYSQLHIPRHRPKVKGRSSHHAPITAARVELTADALRTNGGEELSAWLSVEISARVNNLDNNLGGQSATDVPLDVMIVVDNSTRVPPQLLQGACRNAFLIAASLDPLIDRVAVGCMSSQPLEVLRLMLGLDLHNLDVIRNVFRNLPALRHRDYSEESHLSETIKEASNFLLRHSNASALCHLFLITSRSALFLQDDWNDRIRFHTISPEKSMTINAPRATSGWHLSASLDGDNVDGSVESNTRLLVRHLRTGVDSGVLSDLSVELVTAEEYRVVAMLGESKRRFLRPGESWTILAKVKHCSSDQESVIAASPRSLSNDSLFMKTSMDTDELDNMIDQLHGMLETTVDVEACTIVSANVEYKNSCFADSALLISDGSCEIGRVGAPRTAKKQDLKGKQVITGRPTETSIETLNPKSHPNPWQPTSPATASASRDAGEIPRD